MQVYILYLTTKCNLSCPYCYEGQNSIERKNQSISYEEIDNFLQKIIKEEPSNYTTLCLLGGEPLLEMNKIKYIYDKCYDIEREYNKIITLNVITNGTLINRYIDTWEYLLTDNKTYMSLDISYDGINQYLRTKESNIVEDNISLLVNKNLPFGISYTITSNNCSTDILYNDIITILEKFYPDKNKNLIQNNKKKIRINFDRSNIEKKIGDTSNYINQIKKGFDYLYLQYRIPICEITCSICKRCKKSQLGKTYCIPDKGIISEPKVINYKFNHF